MDKENEKTNINDAQPKLITSIIFFIILDSIFLSLEILYLQ